VKRIVLLNLFFLACAICIFAQTDNTIYVRQFQGSDVGTKLAAAMVTCDPTFRCYLVLDASLAPYPDGTFPALCSKCSLIDYRNGTPWGQSVVNGADPSGARDSTAAIQDAVWAVSQKAVTAGSASSAYRYGGTVTLPSGKFLISSTIYVPSYVTIRGQGRVGFENGNFSLSKSQGAPGTIIYYHPSSGSGPAFQSANFTVSTGALNTGLTDITAAQIDGGTYTEARDVQISDLSIYTDVSGVKAGIYFNGATESRIERVGVAGSFAAGIIGNAGWGNTYNDNLMHLSTVSGAIGMDIHTGANGVKIDGLYSSTNRTDGIALNLRNCSGCSVNNLTLESSKYGLRISGSGNSISGIHAEYMGTALIEDMGSNGLIVTGADVDSSTGAVIYDNQAGNTSANVKLDGVHSDRTISAIFGSIDPYTSVDVDHQQSLPAAETYAAGPNNNVIVHVPWSKTTAVYGTSYVDHFDMPNASAAQYKVGYGFGGNTYYGLKRTPHTWELFDWSSGSSQWVFDFTNHRLATQWGFDLAGFSDGGTTQTWSLDSGTGKAVFASITDAGAKSSSGYNCLQINSSGAISNTGAPCSSSSSLSSSVATIAAGVGAGASPTIACAVHHVCSAMNGTISLTTGTSPAAGQLLTISSATAHTNFPDCIATITLALSPYTAVTDALFTYSTAVWTLNTGSALRTSTSYTITYSCLGY